MTRDTLIDRLVSYADAVAAFAVVNSLAFLLALTETEVRCSLAHLLWLVVTGQIVVGLAMTGSVVALRRVELRLRAPDAPIPVDIQRLLRNLYLARITVIWLSVAAIVPVVRMALSDPVCSTRASWRGPGALSRVRASDLPTLLWLADRRGGPPRAEAGTLAAPCCRRRVP